MRLNTEENLQRFLSTSKSSNYQKLVTSTSPNYLKNINTINTIYTSSKIYSQSKSNKKISTKDNKTKAFYIIFKFEH